MEKVVIFRRRGEADAADVEDDLYSTPEQRIDTVLELQTWMHPDAGEQKFERFIELLNSNKVE